MNEFHNKRDRSQQLAWMYRILLGKKVWEVKTLLIITTMEKSGLACSYSPRAAVPQALTEKDPKWIKKNMKWIKKNPRLIDLRERWGIASLDWASGVGIQSPYSPAGEIEQHCHLSAIPLEYKDNNGKKNKTKRKLEGDRSVPETK